MDELRVIADDLTGACDVGAELLSASGDVLVEPGGAGVAGAPGTLRVRNTQTRTLPPDEAAGGVRRALADLPAGFRGILLKKIDTALRGPLGAELDAAMDAIGAAEAFVLPAIPEVGRTTVDGSQLLDGVPMHETAFARDPQNPVRDARIPFVLAETGRRRTRVVPLAAVRSPDGPAAALADAAAPIAVCDAETDDDLDRTVRVLLGRPRPLVLAGSIGLARALARALGRDRGVPPRAQGPGADARGVLLVVGSAHPASRAQVAHAASRGLLTPVAVDAPDAGVIASRLLADDRAPALIAPAAVVAGGSGAVLAAIRRAALAALARARPRALVLVGGETAWHVLDGLGFPPLRLEARLAPLVVRARLAAGPFAGTPLVTKGGSSGADDLLAALARGMARGGA